MPDKQSPLSKVKASGYGRELSAVGLREFTNIKTVRVRQAGGAHDGKTE